MAIGVLAQLTQQAHDNVTREQNFRSALFQQAETNIQKHQELRIAEQNTINASVSNMIRNQENQLLKQQNQERLQQATDDLIRHRKVTEADAAQRTQLAQDIARDRQAALDAEAERRAQIDATVGEALRSKGFGVGGAGAASGDTQPAGFPDTGTSTGGPSSGPPLPRGEQDGLLLRDPGVGTAGLLPERGAIEAAGGREVITTGRDRRGVATRQRSRLPGIAEGDLATIPRANPLFPNGGVPEAPPLPGRIPNPSIESTLNGGGPSVDGSTLLPQTLDPQTLVPIAQPDPAPVPAPAQRSEVGITAADIIAAADRRNEEEKAADNAQIAKEVVERTPVGQKGQEVILKSPGVDPEATAEQAKTQANTAGVKANPVPSFAFVAFPETTEQQQINQQQINNKNTELNWWQGLAKAAEEGSAGNRAIIQGEVFRLKGEIENMNNNNRLTGVIELTSADLDLITDYNAAHDQDADFVEFVNTSNGEKIRRDIFITRMANKGRGAIAKLRDINADDLADAVEKSIREGILDPGVSRTPRSPAKDATKGKRGTKGPVVSSQLMQTVQETIKQNQQ